MSLWFLRFECYQLLLFILIHSLTNVKIIVEVKESQAINSTIKNGTSAKNRFQEMLFSMNEVLCIKLSSQGQLVLFENIANSTQKERKKNLDFQLFCRKNELSLRLLIYKLRLNNIILQAINHVMSKVNRFL